MGVFIYGWPFFSALFYQKLLAVILCLIVLPLQNGKNVQT